MFKKWDTQNDWMAMEYEVAIFAAVPGTYSYSSEKEIAPGVRVLVPFGKQHQIGVVVAVVNSVKSGGENFELKEIGEVLDEIPTYDKNMLYIAKWMSEYYCHPLGEVFRTMFPVNTGSASRIFYRLTPLGEEQADVGDEAYGYLLKAIFKSRKKLLKPSFAKALKRELEDPEAMSSAALRDLVAKGYIEVTKERLCTARTLRNQSVCATKPSQTQDEGGRAKELTSDQGRVFKYIIQHGLDPQVANLKPFLLFGVTGSGKTQVYLKVIAEVFARSQHSGLGQVLVMVPEISLTPQMTRIFTARFPGRVALVHSRMTKAQKVQALSKIRTGEQQILIGPRSAVFGPFQNLRLIVVDEEHDTSYKQSHGLCYHARDIAILRGRLEGACVILGSATPSMESFQNALTGKYHLLELTQRAVGAGLPKVEIVSALPDKTLQGLRLHHDSGEISSFATLEGSCNPDIIEALRENHRRGNQAMVIVSRRGYANYLLSLKEKKAVSCPNCSISLTLHKKNQRLRCHYCGYQTTVYHLIKQNPDHTYAAVGFGSQQVEDFLLSQLPDVRIVRIDSDTVAADESLLKETLKDFDNGAIDILVGTQILAKGHDFAGVTLIVLLEVDQVLSLPDFRATERSFQLIVQAAGRAGRSTDPGRVLLQTLRPDHPLIQAAILQDFRGFASRELQFRGLFRYPPFTKLMVFNISSRDLTRLTRVTNDMTLWIKKNIHSRKLGQSVRVLGPATPTIEVICGRIRRHVLFFSDNFRTLWWISENLYQAFKRVPRDVRITIDVDPQSLI